MKRSKTDNKIIYKNISPTWTEAVADAETALQEAKKRVRELTVALSILKEKAASRMPFPGTNR